MPAAGPQNTRKRQVKRKPRPKMIPHGPGGQSLRRAPVVKVKPRTPAAKRQGVRVVKKSAQRVDRREAKQRQVKARKYITQDPIKGMQKSEKRAISALSTVPAKKKQSGLSKALHLLGKVEPITATSHTVQSLFKKGAKRLTTGGTSQHNLAAMTTPQLHAIAASGPSKTAGKVIENAAREAIDLPANIVPSVVHVAKPAYKHPTSPKAYVKSAERAGEAVIALPKEYVKSYEKKGLKGVGETAVKHPLTTALTVAPIPRGPGLAAGKVASRLGKMPKIEPRSLPGTALKENVPRSKSYFKAKRQAKKGGGEITEKQGVFSSPIERRVDEHVARAEDLGRRTQATTFKKAYKSRKKVVGKKQARNEAAQLAKQAQEKVRTEQGHRIVEDMGLLEKPKYVSGPKGMRQVSEGGKLQVFEDSASAKSAANIYNRTHKVTMTPIQHPGGYAVIPKQAVKRLEAHKPDTEVGPGRAAVKLYNQLWRKNVLATHPTWYLGNVGEAGLRSAVERVGPFSYYRGYKVGKEYKNTYGKAAHDEMTANISKGGHLQMQTRLPEEVNLTITGGGKASTAARAVQRYRQAPVIRQVADGWTHMTDLTMGTLSGRVESAFQTGMMGKALERHPMMDHHTWRTSNAAIADAVKGLKETHNQIELGRAVDKMYGQYGKFSPGMRRQIANYTPFIAWTLNSLKWLGYYLPKDHPVLTAAAASAQPYVDEWLKDKGLSAFVKGALPSFLQGSVPVKGGYARFPTRYTPFAVASGYPESLATALLPQLEGPYNILAHEINWKGQKLKNPDGSPLDPHQLTILALMTLGQGAIPAAQQFVDPADRYEGGARTPKKLLKPKSGGEIAHAFNPLAKVSTPKDSKKKKGSPSLYGDQKTVKPKSLYGTSKKSKPQSLYP